MRATILSCTLKPSPETSNTEALAGKMITVLETLGVQCETIRLVDLDIKPGVKSDQGEGDDWPGVRQKILESEILVIATPTWIGQPSSVCQRALERMDAMLSEKAPDGRPVAFDRVAGIVVTGNEDGAHHIVGIVSQCLIDIGFTLPGQAWTYWHLGPGAGPDYTKTNQAHDWSDMLARNAARILESTARALQQVPLPKIESS